MCLARSKRLRQASVVTVVAVRFAASSVLRVPWSLFSSRAQQSLTVGGDAGRIHANAAFMDAKFSGNDRSGGQIVESTSACCADKPGE